MENRERESVKRTNWSFHVSDKAALRTLELNCKTPLKSLPKGMSVTMAYNFSASPLSSSPVHEAHLLCNSFFPLNLSQLGTHENLDFPHKPHPTKPSLRIFCKLSLQEHEIKARTQEPASPDQTSVLPSKRHVWVNPKNPQAAKLIRRTEFGRHISLAKLGESLNSCSPTVEDVSGTLSVLADDEITDRDAVVVLNNMSNTKTAPLVLQYFRRKLRSCREIVLYNVTMKVFGKCKDLEGAEKLFDEMLKKGIMPNNVTFSTLISCARRCSLLDKAVEWCEMMRAFALEQDDVTCSLMVNAYGEVGKVDAALTLYERARSEKWRLDALAYSTLIKIYGSRGDFEKCLNLYDEMKALKVRPIASVYNSLMDAMVLAKKPWKAKSIYQEMMENEIEPTWGTYSALIRTYSRLRYGHDAIAIYKEMKEKGLGLTVALYNTLLSMCAAIGFTDEAFAIFEDMKNSGTYKPDKWTYSSLITIYSCSGQVEEAEATLNEMLGSGLEPNIIVLTSIIQCYGKAGRSGDVVKTFNRLSGLGINPDERFIGSLLNVLTQVPMEELGELIVCIEKANAKLGHFVNLLVNGEKMDNEWLKGEANELFGSVCADVRKPYLNTLMDLCVNVAQHERARELFEFGLERGIYEGLMTKRPSIWSLNLKSLSSGAALTALHIWVNDLSRAVESGEELPNLLGINTGHGKHKYPKKRLAGLFEAHLKELNAPFREATDKVGWFETTKVEAVSWLESRRAREDAICA
ncbi:Pentatricopeptide repeat-containing protein -chloroplastic [Striga hermonthica]|uniref:Pentatricopeptide repeat-containing protein -chloroplastic n=1 Tax=Striga hermonthica TaxID=68872 RepID=A0A9N7RMM6_STRHE|nr:Pentatricopeptide repeat-containing protein -chloroplastic [Striga hermonthica]